MNEFHKDCQKFSSKDDLISQKPKFQRYNNNFIVKCFDMCKNNRISFNEEFLDVCGFNGRYKLFRFQEALKRKGVVEPDIYGSIDEFTFIQYMNKLNTVESKECIEIYFKFKKNMYK